MTCLAWADDSSFAIPLISNGFQRDAENQKNNELVDDILSFAKKQNFLAFFKKEYEADTTNFIAENWETEPFLKDLDQLLKKPGMLSLLKKLMKKNEEN